MTVIDEFKAIIKATGNTAIAKEDFPFSIEGTEIIEENGYLTLPLFKYMENDIAKRVIKHCSLPNIFPNMSVDEINRFIDRFEKEQSKLLGFKFALHEEQRSAVIMATNSHFSIITGGPGTGKTCVLNAIRYIEEKRERKNVPLVSFTAPTGKAARRITESVCVPAMTVQKLIGTNSWEDTPYSILADILIIDEISMLDTETLYQIMRALDSKTKLVLIGDVDQLPSVGPGAVLRDLIHSNCVPVTKLEKTFRQGADTSLAKNISYLRQGYAGLEQGDDFKIFSNVNEDNIVETILKTTLDSVEKWGLDNTILLTPYKRKGKTCANKMNELLQEALNPNAKGLQVTLIDEDDETGKIYSYKVCFKIGDPVMHLVNLKKEPVSNGDVGKIIDIKNELITIDFGHYIKTYSPKEYNELTLCYAMSVHKSQGSEYKCVITSVLPEHEKMMNRNMVYTAVTRAKKECILFCDTLSLKKGLIREGGYERTTLLCERLIKEKKRADMILSAS